MNIIAQAAKVNSSLDWFADVKRPSHNVWIKKAEELNRSLASWNEMKTSNSYAQRVAEHAHLPHQRARSHKREASLPSTSRLSFDDVR